MIVMGMMPMDDDDENDNNNRETDETNLTEKVVLDHDKYIENNIKRSKFVEKFLSFFKKPDFDNSCHLRKNK